MSTTNVFSIDLCLCLSTDLLFQCWNLTHQQISLIPGKNLHDILGVFGLRGYPYPVWGYPYLSGGTPVLGPDCGTPAPQLQV